MRLVVVMLLSVTAHLNLPATSGTRGLRGASRARISAAGSWRSGQCDGVLRLAHRRAGTGGPAGATGARGIDSETDFPNCKVPIRLTTSYSPAAPTVLVLAVPRRGICGSGLANIGAAVFSDEERSTL